MEHKVKKGFWKTQFSKKLSWYVIYSMAPAGLGSQCLPILLIVVIIYNVSAHNPRQEALLLNYKVIPPKQYSVHQEAMKQANRCVWGQ